MLQFDVSSYHCSYYFIANELYNVIIASQLFPPQFSLNS